MDKEEQKIISEFVSSTIACITLIMGYDYIYVLLLHSKKTSLVRYRCCYPTVVRESRSILLLRVAGGVSSHHDLPPLKAATTDAALGGRVGSASLLNMFLTGGTQMGNAAPTKPKAHDHTTIGSLCKNVVQNPAMSFSSGGCFFSFRSSALSGRQKRKRGVKTHGRSRVFEEEDFRSFRKKRQKDEGSRGGKKEQEEKHIFSPRRKINKSFVSSKSSL